MRAIETTRRSGVAVTLDATVRHAASVMEQAGVGALAVLDGDHLAGIVTDRDLVRRVLARGLSPDARVDGVMSSPVITIDAGADLHDSFALFRSNAVRRLAVTDRGHFVGMITIDDLLIDLAGDLADLARPVTAEVLFAHRDNRVPATT